MITLSGEKARKYLINEEKGDTEESWIGGLVEEIV
jgi:hypothetical protein